MERERGGEREGERGREREGERGRGRGRERERWAFELGPRRLRQVIYICTVSSVLPTMT